MTARFVMLTAALLSATAMSGSAADVVEIHLYGHYYSEPATVRIVVAVEPDEANRLLRIEADGDRMFRATEVTLDGLAEKRMHNVEFKNLPAGLYELRAAVMSATDVRGMATQELEVMGGGR